MRNDDKWIHDGLEMRWAQTGMPVYEDEIDLDAMYFVDFACCEITKLPPTLH